MVRTVLPAIHTKSDSVMNIHDFQANHVLQDAEVAVLANRVARSPEEATAAFGDLREAIADGARNASVSLSSSKNR